MGQQRANEHRYLLICEQDVLSLGFVKPWEIILDELILVGDEEDLFHRNHRLLFVLKLKGVETERAFSLPFEYERLDVWFFILRKLDAFGSHLISVQVTLDFEEVLEYR